MKHDDRLKIIPRGRLGGQNKKWVSDIDLDT